MCVSPQIIISNDLCLFCKTICWFFVSCVVPRAVSFVRSFIHSFISAVRFAFGSDYLFFNIQFFFLHLFCSPLALFLIRLVIISVFRCNVLCEFPLKAPLFMHDLDFVQTNSVRCLLCITEYNDAHTSDVEWLLSCILMKFQCWQIYEAMEYGWKFQLSISMVVRENMLSKMF